MRNPNIKLLIFLKSRLALKAHSKQEIANLWLERTELEISLRTVDRNVEFLRGLGYEIVSGYELRKRTYRIVDEYENEILEKIENHLRILDMPELANPVNVASPPFQRGVEWLPILLDSINKRLAIEFQHNPYTSEPSLKKVCPLILKEYYGKWHLHGYDLNLKKYRTYGIDRIREPKQLDKCDWNQFPDLEKEITLFKSRLGAAKPLELYFNKRDIKPDIIKLRVSSFYLNYLKSKPIHQSQEILENDVIQKEKFTTGEILDYTLVEYFLVPNYDLVKFIVSGLGDIIIEDPKSLKEYLSVHFQDLIKELV